MKYFEIELNDKVIKLRLRASDSVALEKRTGKGFFELIEDFSITNITMILMYLKRHEDRTFKEEDAFELYDELVDAGYTAEKIMFDIIYEALVVSGFLDKTQLEEIKQIKLEMKEKNKEKIIEKLEK